MQFWKIGSKIDKEVDIAIYGDIGESFFGEDATSASKFKKDIDALGDVRVMNISVNSPGGSVFDGLAIYNILKRHKAKKNVIIDGLAASAASFIAMAGDTIKIPANAYMMIHRASTLAYGNAEELLKAVDLLQKMDDTIAEIYVDKTNRDKDEIIKMLDAETWMNGKEAVEMGFADVLEEEKRIAACVGGFFMPKYQKVPENLCKTPSEPEADLFIYEQDFNLLKRRLQK